MPIYVYCDDAGHKQEVAHRMLDTPCIVCECGLQMYRKPQAALINWGAFRKELHPNIKNLIESAPERRDKFAQEHEEHERRTENAIRGQVHGYA